MSPGLLLVKCITLLYRESIDGGDKSIELVKGTLTNLKLPETITTTGKLVEQLAELKNLVLHMVYADNNEVYDKEDILQTIELACARDDKLSKLAKSAIDKEISPSKLKKSILSLKRSISGHDRELEISKILSRANYEYRNRSTGVLDTKVFMSGLIEKLEGLNVATDTRDPGIIESVDFDNVEAMSGLFDDVKNDDTGDGILKTGWSELNDMLQGGFRRGDFVMLNGLQGTNKTGISLTLFKQIAIYNKPFLFDKTKKPLIVRLSLEDPLKSNFQFLYINIKSNENGVIPDISNISSMEMAEYVKKHMQKNGYNIKMLRVVPDEWSYRNILDLINGYIADGYEIHAVIIDHGGLIPTTHCTKNAGTGSDILNLFKRLRNFFNPRKITCILPYQLSDDAKKLLREGLPPEDLPKLVAEKGYTKGCRGLDQEVDVELAIHLGSYNKKTYQYIQRGKHRLPGCVVDEELKYFMLPFEGKLPLLDNIDKPHQALRSFKDLKLSGNPDEDFNFD